LNKIGQPTRVAPASEPKMKCSAVGGWAHTSIPAGTLGNTDTDRAAAAALLGSKGPGSFRIAPPASYPDLNLDGWGHVGVSGANQ